MNLETLGYEQARRTRDARFDGHFFVAVKSTGIFCRPICPAPSPKEKNVEYFSLAQLAMQAGYRPCLRCRPDAAPCSFAWKGVDTTVGRAVNLIKSHPELTIQQICEKLGVTDRYLRALFSQKLGIAPKKYRLYGQLLFAKQLLHQTSLNIEEVAQASGFASARRLQSNLKSSLKLTPSHIRRESVERGKLQSSSSLTLQLSYRLPYNWPHLRDFLRIRAIQGIETVAEQSYARFFRLGDAKGYFNAKHNPLKRRFDVELEIDDIRSIQTVVFEIKRVLDCDADPVSIEQALINTGVPKESLVSGIRIPGVWDAFEAGCRAILGQQISVKAAINLTTQLCQELGEPLDGQIDGSVQDRILFPTAKAVAESPLAFLKIPQKRRDCLRAFAQFNVLNPNASQLDDWLSIKGIGPWTVAYAKMRGQSNPDIWLNTDLIIKKQIQQFSLNPAAAAAWRSYLTFQLWSMA